MDRCTRYGLLATAIVILGGCGAHLGSVGALPEAHREGAIPYGAYRIDDEFVLLLDGSGDADQVCSPSEVDQLSEIKFYNIISDDAQHIVLITFSKVKEPDSFEFYAFLRVVVMQGSGVYAFHDPITHAINQDVLPPFLEPCPSLESRDTASRSAWSSHRYCPKPGVDADHLGKWLAGVALGEPEFELRRDEELTALILPADVSLDELSGQTNCLVVFNALKD